MANIVCDTSYGNFYYWISSEVNVQQCKTVANKYNINHYKIIIIHLIYLILKNAIEELHFYSALCLKELSLLDITQCSVIHQSVYEYNNLTIQCTYVYEYNNLTIQCTYVYEYNNLTIQCTYLYEYNNLTIQCTYLYEYNNLTIQCTYLHNYTIYIPGLVINWLLRCGLLLQIEINPSKRTSV